MNIDDWSNNYPSCSPARTPSEHEYSQFFSTNLDDTITSDSISCDEIISRVNAFGRRWNLDWAMRNSNEAANSNTSCSPLQIDESHRKLCMPTVSHTPRSRQFTKQDPPIALSPGPRSRPCPKLSPLPFKSPCPEIPGHQREASMPSSLFYPSTSATHDTTGPCSEPTSEFEKKICSRDESSDEQNYSNTSRIKQTTAEELGLSSFSYNSDGSSEYYNQTLEEECIPIQTEHSKCQNKLCKNKTLDSSILDLSESSFQPVANSSLSERQLNGTLEDSLVTPTMVKMYAHRKQILGEEDAIEFIKDAKDWHRRERMRGYENENVHVRIPRPPEGQYGRGGRKLPLASQETIPLLTPRHTPRIESAKGTQKIHLAQGFFTSSDNSTETVQKRSSLKMPPIPQTCPTSIKHTVPDNWRQTDDCPELLNSEEPPIEYYELDSSDEVENEPWQGRYGMYGCQYIPKPPEVCRYIRTPEGQYSAGGRKLPLAPQEPIQSLSSRHIPGIESAMRIRKAREAKDLCKIVDVHRETVQRRPCLKKPASCKYPTSQPCLPNINQTTLDNFQTDYSQDLLNDEYPPSDYFDLASSDEDENQICQGVRRSNHTSSYTRPTGCLQRGNQLKSPDNKPRTCICPDRPERDVQWAPNENVGCFTSVPRDAEFGFNSEFSPEFANTINEPFNGSNLKQKNSLGFGTGPVREVDEKDLYLKPTANFEMESSDVKQSFGYSSNTFGDDVLDDNKWALEESSPVPPVFASSPFLVRQYGPTQSHESTEGGAINTNHYSRPPLDTSSEINAETASGEGLLDFLDSRQISNPFHECDYGEETQLMYDNTIGHDGTSMEPNLRKAER